MSRLSGIEKAALAGSVVAAIFLVIDPLVLQAVRLLDPGVRSFFRSFTDLGKSGWILIPLGVAIIGLYLYRARQYSLRALVASGYMIQVTGFVFVSVAATSLAGSLIKNIIGRGRPKFFEQVGSVEFRPFTFDYDFASFPSGHATTICALAAALGILWPRARVLLFVAAAWIAATRFLIGSHYLADVLGGAALGFSAPYLLRDRLAVRRWLFEKADGGGVRLRGQRLWRGLGQRIDGSAMRWLPGADRRPD